MQEVNCAPSREPSSVPSGVPSSAVPSSAVPSSLNPTSRPTSVNETNSPSAVPSSSAPSSSTPLSSVPSSAVPSSAVPSSSTPSLSSMPTFYNSSRIEFRLFAKNGDSWDGVATSMFAPDDSAFYSSYPSAGSNPMVSTLIPPMDGLYYVHTMFPDGVVPAGVTVGDLHCKVRPLRPSVYIVCASNNVNNGCLTIGLLGAGNSSNGIDVSRYVQHISAAELQREVVAMVTAAFRKYTSARSEL